MHISYLTERAEQCFLEQEASEALNCAVLDSGCTFNAVGINWLHCYLDTLPSNITLQERPSGKTFRFGPSKSYPSLKQVIIPANNDDRVRDCCQLSVNGVQVERFYFLHFANLIG